jgi:hypothetical protein
MQVYSCTSKFLFYKSAVETSAVETDSMLFHNESQQMML